MFTSRALLRTTSNKKYQVPDAQAYDLPMKNLYKKVTA
jgi:hypothetical protein